MDHIVRDGRDGDRVLQLPDGLAVGFREYGSPDGTPMLFFHGWPGSSRQGIFLHRMGLERGYRIIAIDRPGFGSSGRIPGRNFLHVPPLADALLEALQIGRCCVLGVSGGGPYALACAWALPHRITTAIVCCGAPPIDTPEAKRRFSPVYQALLALHSGMPRLLRGIVAAGALATRVRPPWPVLRLVLNLTGPRDRLFLANRAHFDNFYPSFRDAMRAGSGAILEDGDCYAKPWPFDVSEIRIPVRFWHGTQDSNFHHSLAETLAARVPGAVFHLREEGHYSLPAFRLEEMMDDLQSVTALR